MKYGAEPGYAYALPRLLARLTGPPVRRAELCRWELYGLGLLVLAIWLVFGGHLFCLFVRPLPLRLLWLLVLPVVAWIAFLLLAYVNALVLRVLRRLGLYHEITNKPFQSLVLLALTTVVATLLLREESTLMCSLGTLWLGLLLLNLAAGVLLRILGEK